MPTSFQYASDLHLETYSKHTPKLFESLLEPSADYLILAGDIGWSTAPYMKLFLSWCSERWKKVFWVFGNHEYYNKHPPEKWVYKKPETMYERELSAKTLCAQFPNVIVLLNESYLLEDTTPPIRILGTTLWTFLPRNKQWEIQYEFNDTVYICVDHEGQRPFQISDWCELHKFHRESLELTLEQAKKAGEKCVVITHHLPTYSLIAPQYQGHPLNCGFASELDELVKHPSVLAWVCGHSHAFVNRTLKRDDGSTVLLGLNARGYKFEKGESYSRKAVLTVPFVEPEEAPITESVEAEDVDFV